MPVDTKMPVQVLLAVASIAASLIAALGALITLALSKEQKVSEMRQAWVDALRDDLSIYLLSYRFLATAVEDTWRMLAQKGQTTHAASAEQVASQLGSGAAALYRIKLRLNRTEKHHVELAALLENVGAAYNDTPNGDLQLRGVVLQAIERAVPKAQDVLKHEWERVKRGEFAFKVSRYLAALVLALAIGALALFVFSTKFTAV